MDEFSTGRKFVRYRVNVAYTKSDVEVVESKKNFVNSKLPLSVK